MLMLMLMLMIIIIISAVVVVVQSSFYSSLVDAIAVGNNVNIVGLGDVVLPWQT